MNVKLYIIGQLEDIPLNKSLAIDFMSYRNCHFKLFLKMLTAIWHINS